MKENPEEDEEDAEEDEIPLEHVPHDSFDEASDEYATTYSDGLVSVPNERMPDSYSTTEVDVTFVDEDSLAESALVSDEKVPVMQSEADEHKINATIQMYYRTRAHIS